MKTEKIFETLLDKTTAEMVSIMEGGKQLSEDDLSNVISTAWQGVMDSINSAESADSFVAAIEKFTDFQKQYSPIPEDMILPFKKVVTDKAKTLNVVPTLAQGADEAWAKVAPFLGSIISISGTSNPGA